MSPIILTNIPATISPTWTANTHLLEGSKDSLSTDPHISGLSRLQALKTSWRLFRKRNRIDCYITTGDITGLALALLQSIFFFRKKPHFIMSAIWAYPRNAFEHCIRRILIPFAYKSIANTFVNTTYEVDSYSRVFGIPKEKLSFLPYQHRLTGYDYTVVDEGYIWSGGNGDRDYKMLADAISGIQMPILINATRASLFSHFTLPANVTVEKVTPSDFRKRMAACHFAVIPMLGNRLHPGGQQTFLALMKMGKTVVLTDTIGGSDYIKHARSGFLVPAGDVAKLREIVTYLVQHPEVVKEVGQNAMAAVSHLNEDHYMASILKAVYRQLQWPCPDEKQTP